MPTLTIRHVPGDGPPQFQVVRLKDGKSAPAVSVPSPVGFPVEGRPNSDLLQELRWYLETFLEYPFSPETEHAERVQDALRRWGEEAFTALFGDRQGGGLFDTATAGGYEKLRLQIASDDPRVLGWPWEALRDPQARFLAQTCQIERRLNNVRDPQPLSDRLPSDRINILLVTARPYEADVQYRSLSRPLVELIADRHLPAQVTVLRPPTLGRLREHLRERPHFYHILHFDGHGSYRVEAPGGGHTLQGPQGRLIFEDADGKADPITAEQLSVLLREYQVPAVVLNACQSGMVDHQAEDAFASVAASLLLSGIRSVVAMAYSLYVSGGQEFLPAFYRRLFESGSIAEATRAGRQQMYAQQGRVCARGRFPLQDWLVPVLYQQEELDLSFLQARQAPAAPQGAPLPAEASDAENPYGFVGRDGALLALERALRRRPAGILLQGIGGVGKTTLARGFVRWLHATDGLPGGCLWFFFGDIRSAEYVVNRLGEALIDPQFGARGMDEKVEALAAALKERRCLIVWDNFESVCGIAGTSVAANLSAEDQAVLRNLLTKMRGGQSKVLITSRSEEEWLGTTNRFKLSIGGLEGEERWEYCATILRDLGITIDRKDQALVGLMDLLGGHPLAMRAILPKLEKRTAAEVVQALQGNLSALQPGADGAEAKLYATLRFVQESLPKDAHGLLLPLALHEGFVDADLLEVMADAVGAGWGRARIDELLAALVSAGLLRDRGQAIYEMHPVLTGFLRSTYLNTSDPATSDAWRRAFVEVMAGVAETLAPKELHEQRPGFHLHGANFHYAAKDAERLRMDDPWAALAQALAAYARNCRNYATAEGLLARFAESREARGDPRTLAAAYHQLGVLAQERRDLAAAERWYQKSLAISEKQGDEHYAALTYHQLGVLAQVRRDLAAAERWYQKALAISEKQGDERGAAGTYHQLGVLAQERRDLAAAERWYQKALAIKEKQGDEYGAASTHGQLGLLAALQGHFEEAGRRFLTASVAFARANDRHLMRQSAQNFVIAYRSAPAADQAKLKALWAEAGLGSFPEQGTE